MRAIGMGLGLAGMVLGLGCWNGPGPAVEAPPVVARIQPAAATVTVGRSLAFTARVDDAQAEDATWSVLESGGGAIDGAGAYRAPGTPGVYTVRAQFKSMPGLAAAAKVTVVAPPAGEIIAPPLVLPGAGGQVARIAPVPGSQYLWTIEGGLITAGTDTPAVTFEAGAGPRLVLACRVTNAAGDALRTSLGIPVAAPVSLAIKPAALTITAERSMKFGFDLAGGTSLGVTWSLGEPGAGSLDDSGNYLAPAVPGLYTVRVSSKDDPTVSSTAKVKVVAKPPESLFAPDSFLPGADGLRATVPEADGMTYAWEIEGGIVSSGASGPVLVFQAGQGPTLTLRCRISNEAGDSYLAVKVIKTL